MFRSRIPRIGQSLRISRRCLHSMPPLTHYEAFQRAGIEADGEKGAPLIPGLLSPLAFDISWHQYQNLIIEKLNVVTLGTDDEKLSPSKIAIKYARDPQHPSHFNYASMAFNNHFFFEGLSPNGPKGTPIPGKLEEELIKNFGTLETLRTEMVTTARAMFGPGFVWLVTDGKGKYSTLCTYLAGSPLPEAHFRKQPVDMSTENETQAEAIRRRNAEAPVNSAGAFGKLSGKQKVAPGAAIINPVLCLNTWEHVYLPDYSVGELDERRREVGGKKAYAEAWWDVIDWNVVAERANLLTPEQRTLEQ